MVFTDGSSTNTGPQAGVSSKMLNVQESCRLKVECSVLQADIIAMGRATRLLQIRVELGTKNFVIYNDKIKGSGELSRGTVVDREEQLQFLLASWAQQCGGKSNSIWTGKAWGEKGQCGSAQLSKTTD